MNEWILHSLTKPESSAGLFFNAQSHCVSRSHLGFYAKHMSFRNESEGLYSFPLMSPVPLLQTYVIPPGSAEF